MQTAIRVQTKVQSSGKIEISVDRSNRMIAGCALFITHDPVFRRVPELQVSILSDEIA
jgi:hypothetical protein